MSGRILKLMGLNFSPKFRSPRNAGMGGALGGHTDAQGCLRVGSQVIRVGSQVNCPFVPMLSPKSRRGVTDEIFSFRAGCEDGDS